MYVTPALLETRFFTHNEASIKTMFCNATHIIISVVPSFKVSLLCDGIMCLHIFNSTGGSCVNFDDLRIASVVKSVRGNEGSYILVNST